MNRHSILFKLNILFSIAVIATLFASFSVALHISKKEHREFFYKARLISKEIRTTQQIPHALLEEFKLKPIYGAFKKEVLFYATQRKVRAKKRILLSYKGQRYLHLKLGKMNLLLQDKQTFIGKFLLFILVLLGFLSMLVLMYLSLRRSLVPLKRLEQDIRYYGEGGLPHYQYLSKKDEVSLATNAFYDTIKKVENLKASRELFIRNLFHELNTPVTKGKILVELVDEPKTKVMLDSIFTRLSLLLKELAQMEQFGSGNYALLNKPIRIQELIDEACDLLYLDTPIPSNISDEILEVDFASMRIVFKNLIENAYKYGKNIEIRIDKKTISFISEGKALQKSLSYYTEAFSKENESEGFGLGLYIVNAILRKHAMDFEYRYEGGKNIFVVI